MQSDKLVISDAPYLFHQELAHALRDTAAIGPSLEWEGKGNSELTGERLQANVTVNEVTPASVRAFYGRIWKDAQLVLRAQGQANVKKMDMRPRRHAVAGPYEPPANA